MSGVMSAVEAGSGVAVAVDFGYSFGNRVKFLRLTPEPKPFSVGIVASKRAPQSGCGEILAVRERSGFEEMIPFAIR